jgi:membrane protease YdiL (CAAX protease family)
MVHGAAGHSVQPRGWEFIGLAGLGINTARSYAVAALVIVLCPLAAAVLLGVAQGFWAALKHDSPDSLGPLAAIMEQYGPIVVAGAAVVFCTDRTHRRPWRSLISPDLRIDWRRVAIGFGVELAILGGQLGLVHAAVGWPWEFSLGAALPSLVLGLVLVPLQAASEELLFRGYLTQALGRIVRSRAAIVLAVGIAFGSLHLNACGPLTVPYFVLVSLIFSLASLRDDRLELAIGGHAGMNLFAFTVATSIASEPALIGGVQSATPFNWAAVAVLLANGVLFHGLTRLLVRLFCGPRMHP